MEFTGIALVAALVSPLLVQTITSKCDSHRVKTATALLIALYLGLVYTVVGVSQYLPYDLSTDPALWFETLLVASLAVFGAQQLSYHILLRDSALQKTIDRMTKDVSGTHHSGRI